MVPGLVGEGTAGVFMFGGGSWGGVGPVPWDNPPLHNRPGPRRNRCRTRAPPPHLLEWGGGGEEGKPRPPPPPPAPFPVRPLPKFPYRLRRPPRSWRRFSTGQLPCVKWEGF